MQKQDLTGPLYMAGYKRSCFLLPNRELADRSQMGQPELATDPNTLLCLENQQVSWQACVGETAFLDETGFPNSPAPQPSIVNYEFAVAFTKPPA